MGLYRVNRYHPVLQHFHCLAVASDASTAYFTPARLRCQAQPRPHALSVAYSSNVCLSWEMIYAHVFGLATARDCYRELVDTGASIRGRTLDNVHTFQQGLRYTF